MDMLSMYAHKEHESDCYSRRSHSLVEFLAELFWKSNFLNMEKCGAKNKNLYIKS